MAVLKEARSIGEVVFIDNGESDKVPEAIRNRLSGGALPVVVIADPKGEKVYGRYDHATLKTKDFNSIFRQAKKELREDLKNAAVAGPGTTPESGSSTPGGGSTPPSTLKPQGASKYANLPFEQWESLKGTKIEAKVEDIRGDEVTLKTKDGRVIKLKQYQLSGESLKRLKQISG